MSCSLLLPSVNEFAGGAEEDPGEDGGTIVDVAFAVDDDATKASDSSNDDVGAFPPCPDRQSLSPFDADAGWKLLGNATPTSAGVQLTANSPSQRGALFFDRRLSFSALDATIHFRIVKDGSTTADGIAIVWLYEEQVPNELVGLGPDFGIKGKTGYAVLVDTHINYDLGDPTYAPFVAVRTTNNMVLVDYTAQLPTLHDGSEHVLRVRVRNDRASVFVDDVHELVNVPVDGSSNYYGYFGVVATTSAQFAVQSVSFLDLRAGLEGPCPVID